VAMFSKALNAENPHVHVQAQVPLFVATKLASMRPSLTVPTPDAYARYACSAIGYETVVSPHWTHSPQLYLMQALPEWVSNAIVGSMHHGIRTKGFIKAAKKEYFEKNKKALQKANPDVTDEKALKKISDEQFALAAAALREHNKKN
jgi:hypothetical protein